MSTSHVNTAGRGGTAWFAGALVSLMAVPVSAAGLSQPVWPQWRGPTRDARVDSQTWLPETLDGVQQIWRVELGPGYPGPIVAEDRVFVAATKDRKEEIVRALDRKTGALIWEITWPGAMKVPFFARDNGDWIRSTPAYDGESLYVGGMRDVLVCLDAATGAVRWRVDFVDRFNSPLPAFGLVSSPLVIGDAVYIQAGSSFVKLDKKDGGTIWRTLIGKQNGMYDSAFSLPLLTSINGVEQILVQTRTELTGIDPETGVVWWRREVPSFRGMNILTPAVHDGHILTSSYKNATYFFSVDREEDDWKISLDWKNKAAGYMSSPVILDGHAYLHLSNDRLSCIDLSTGEEKWRTRPQGNYWSMVTDGDKILALNETGELFLIKADDTEYRLLDTRQVASQETWGHLAVAGNELFLRELKGISAYRLTGSTATATGPLP
jgi:outer membrane protein assembly factor BamB